MILITTDSDLIVRIVPFADVEFHHLKANVFRATLIAEDVYFWRNGGIKALKRLNAPLGVPDFLIGVASMDK